MSRSARPRASLPRCAPPLADRAPRCLDALCAPRAWQRSAQASAEAHLPHPTPPSPHPHPPFPPTPLAAYLSSEAQSLLKALLQKEAPKRLGFGPNGSKDVMGHAFFKGVNWKQLEARQVGRRGVAGGRCRLCCAVEFCAISCRPSVATQVVAIRAEAAGGRAGGVAAASYGGLPLPQRLPPSQALPA